MVSVIITTFNRALLLKECLKSISKQTFSDLEVIIIDNGSEDNTKDIVHQFDFLNIKYRFVGKLKNIAFCRNVGINCSNGQFIAFCDDDDIWEPEKLEVQLQFMDKYNVVTSNSKVIDQTGIVLKRKYFPDIEKDFVLNLKTLIRRNRVLTSCVMLKRNILNDIEVWFDDIKFKNFAEDYDFWLRLSKKNDIYFINKGLACIRRHENIHKDPVNSIAMSENFVKLYRSYRNYDDIEIRRYSNLNIIIIKYILFRERLKLRDYKNSITDLVELIKFLRFPLIFIHAFYKIYLERLIGKREIEFD